MDRAPRGRRGLRTLGVLLLLAIAGGGAAVGWQQREIAAGLPTATLRTTPLVIGEPVAAIGYPGGGGAAITTGKVLGFTDGPVLVEQVPAIRVDAEVRPGNSGGPHVDADGLVIGVIFALTGVGGDELAVPVDVLLDRLDQQGFLPPNGC